MSYDPVIKEHQEWLGFLQPVGLVVSPTALKNAQARIARNVINEQEILLRHTHEVTDENRNVKRRLNRFTEFAKEFWHWEESDLASPPDTVSTILQEYGEILRPEFAVPGVKGEAEWQILIQELPAAITMDQGGQNADERSWQASPQARFERLLRDTGIPIGLLVNPDAIRLVYAPRGETAGHITFPIQAMCETAGRPIVAALHLLLDDQRLFALPKDQRLPAILQASRKYQNEVSIQLADQVLRALNELCRGFNEANRATNGELLAQTLQEAPEDVYGGLLTTLMRLVFLLYAEDRNLMASDETYARCYSLIGLHEKLREDDAAYHDVMDQRFGAWAQFLTLSRIVHDGGGHGNWKIPARRGRLFDPDCYPFLEGRTYKHKRTGKEKLSPPKVSDGVLFRVLEDLLYLDGERISYRALDVEQIGSVYEAMMGFEVKKAAGPSIGFKPDHVVIDLQMLLDQPPTGRKRWIKETLGWEPAEKAAQSLKSADSSAAILVALSGRISPLYSDQNRGTLPVSVGDIYLEPTEERRRSGSHYTPRSLTEPIVRMTLEPILNQLGEKPTPEQILQLKICDPAMGSGAFLVEACRYLGDALVKAWAANNVTPEIPADQDPLLHARRIVAQRCLYGVDKNHFAVDLAKLSLWLATFAKNHPFTFLDHSFRKGDSLVGLNVKQIIDALGEGSTLFRPIAELRLAEVTKNRRSILDADEDTPYDSLENRYARSQESLGTVRDLGDAMVAAFFLGHTAKDRATRRSDLAYAFEKNQFDTVARSIRELETGRSGVVPFHWEAEFPEVFSDGGFSAIVGNPPFLGGQFISGTTSAAYLDFLKSAFEGTERVTDLVAYFFRKAFLLIRETGTLGLIATNTISQGDTRLGSLYYIRRNRGWIYSAVRRLKWPGAAAVVVSQIHIRKGLAEPAAILDGTAVPEITSYLQARGGDDAPKRLAANTKFSHHGSYIYGAGFTFDDNDPVATPLSVANDLLEKFPQYARRILPYLSGEDILRSPTQSPSRFVIDLHDLEEAEAKTEFPDLMKIVELRVKPERLKLKDNTDGLRYKAQWWKWARHSNELDKEKHSVSRLLVHPFTSSNVAFAFSPTSVVVGSPHNVFTIDSYAAFAILQSRVHEIWARAFGSSLKDDLRYTRSDCFETFPFPQNWSDSESLAEIGKTYYEFRADLMISNNEGLTTTYNRFHDKYEDDPGIERLRELHGEMDRIALDSYGWVGLQPNPIFILDYREPDEDPDRGKGRKRKEPWRFRWADEFCDDIVARLLELNGQRAKQELEAPPQAKLKAQDAAGTKNPRKTKDEGTLNMFTEEPSQ